MKRGMWFGSEDYPGPAHRRRWPVSSQVRKYTHTHTSKVKHEQCKEVTENLPPRNVSNSS